jgi:methyl-accepting chemotaxis protein
MEEGCRRANESVEQAETAGQSLAEITQSVSRISEMNEQIANAVEQQLTVTEELGRNVSGINHAVEAIEADSNHTLATSQMLVKLAADINGMAQRFAA